jgi:UDP-N-acetylglucosamine 2-epimerase (non-hydrolysing)
MMGSFLESSGLEVDFRLEPRAASGPLSVSAGGGVLAGMIEILDGLGRLFARHRPRLVLAVGDTTTVFAAALAARKSGIAFGHVEAGLRAFSRELPEEEHRICADALGDLLFAPTPVAVDNLVREQVNGRIILSGNPVLDALRAHAPPATRDDQRTGILVTLHRRETVDQPDRLRQVLDALDALGRSHRVTWPIHPRTRSKLAAAGLACPAQVEVVDPLGHHAFLAELAAARLVVTDSGGVQEEAAILGTPCVTVRNHTERPETVTAGVGLLAAVETRAILDSVDRITADWKRFARPRPELYGDGHAADRIAEACADWLGYEAIRMSS